MKKIINIAVLTTILMGFLSARDRVIDKNTVLGAPWKTTIEELSEIVGKEPIGAIRLNSNQAVYFWGKGVAIIMGTDGIESIYLSSHSLIDHQLAQLINGGMNASGIVTGPGIEFEMTPKEIEVLTGQKVSGKGYQESLEHDGLLYHLGFSRHTSVNKEQSYRLYEIMVSRNNGSDKGGLNILNFLRNLSPN